MAKIKARPSSLIDISLDFWFPFVVSALSDEKYLLDKIFRNSNL